MLISTLVLLLYTLTFGIPVTEANRNSTILAGSISKDAAPGWVNSAPGRGTYELLTSCFLTLALCAWSAYHPNIPSKMSWLGLFWWRVQWVIMAIFCPEVMLALACYQVHTSWQLMKELNAIAMLRKPNGQNPLDLSTQENGKDSSCNPESSEALTCSARRRSTWPEPAESNALSPLPGNEKNCHARWTLKHTLFALSGGIAVDSSSFYPFERITFGPRGLMVLARLGILPDISLEDIEDKSKADGGAKVLVCVQVSWFFIQCIARVVQGLGITLLEVHTSIHIVCAILLYIIWAKKPYDINAPVLVKDERVIDLAAFFATVPGNPHDSEILEELRSCSSQSDKITLEHIRSAHERPSYNFLSWKRLKLYYGHVIYMTRHGEYAPWASKPAAVDKKKILEHLRRSDRAIGFMRNQGCHVCWIELGLNNNTDPKDLNWPVGRSIAFSDSKAYVRFRSAAFQVEDILDQKDDLPASSDLMKNASAAGAKKSSRSNADLEKHSMSQRDQKPSQSLDDAKYNTFTRTYSFLVTYSLRKWVFMFISACYGGAHLAAWNSHFPTVVEMWMWRVSGLVLAASPPAIGLVKWLQDVENEMQKRKRRSTRPKSRVMWTVIIWLYRIPAWIFGLVALAIISVYIPGRIFVIVESLISLRSPPLGTYQTVNWSRYIPHIN